MLELEDDSIFALPPEPTTALMAIKLSLGALGLIGFGLMVFGAFL